MTFYSCLFLPCPVLPRAPRDRAVPDQSPLVPDGVCQRGAHEGSAARLGSLLLRGLHGTLPDDTRHAQDEGGSQWRALKCANVPASGTLQPSQCSIAGIKAVSLCALNR